MVRLFSSKLRNHIGRSQSVKHSWFRIPPPPFEYNFIAWFRLIDVYVNFNHFQEPSLGSLPKWSRRSLVMRRFVYFYLCVSAHFSHQFVANALPRTFLSKSWQFVQVDVWSFGVVLWEMLTREQPYKNIDSMAIIWGVGSKWVFIHGRIKRENIMRISAKCLHKWNVFSNETMGIYHHFSKLNRIDEYVKLTSTMWSFQPTLPSHSTNCARGTQAADATVLVSYPSGDCESSYTILPSLLLIMQVKKCAKWVNTRNGAISH